MLKIVLVSIMLGLGFSASAKTAPPRELLGTFGQKFDNVDWSYTFREDTVTFTAVCGSSRSEVTVSVEYTDGGFIPGGTVVDPKADGGDYCTARITGELMQYSLDGDQLIFVDPILDRQSTPWIRRP